MSKIPLAQEIDQHELHRHYVARQQRDMERQIRDRLLRQADARSDAARKGWATRRAKKDAP